MAEFNFNKVMKAAMRLPVITVSREPFLRKELQPYCNQETIERAIRFGTKGVIDKKIIDKIAKGCITYQTSAVCSISALAGLPGGWTMAATIPADVTQFYGNAIALAEKLLYLYGWPDIMGEGGEVTDQTSQTMLVWLGVMAGAQGAEAGVRALLSALGKTAEKKLVKSALTKSGIYTLTKTICKWFGKELTKEGFAKGVGKMIPLAGAPISAGITYFSFHPMCKRLKKELDFQWENCMGNYITTRRYF